MKFTRVYSKMYIRKLLSSVNFYWSFGSMKYTVIKQMKVIDI